MAAVSGTMDSHLLAVSGVSSCCPCSEAELNPTTRGERSRVALPPCDLSTLTHTNREKQNGKIRTFDRRLPTEHVESQSRKRFRSSTTPIELLNAYLRAHTRAYAARDVNTLLSTTQSPADPCTDETARAPRRPEGLRSGAVRKEAGWTQEVKEPRRRGPPD